MAPISVSTSSLAAVAASIRRKTGWTAIPSRRAISRAMRLLEVIRRNIDEIERDVQRGEYRIGKSFDFHRAIAVASQNPFIVEALVRVQDFIGFKIYMARSMSLPNPVERLALVNGEHSAILSHIERRESGAARDLMRSHIERARDLFLGCLPLDGDGGFAGTAAESRQPAVT
ncbi:MAG: FCD domain-containing protein [Parvibaculaceae bacterium]